MGNGYAVMGTELGRKREYAKEMIRMEAGQAKKVTVYSTPACPFCVLVKNFLKQNKVEFREIDISVDKAAAERILEKAGVRSVPITEIGGELVVGYDIPKIKALLGLA